MISEGDRRDVLVSSSIFPQRKNLRTVSPAEAEPSHCTSGARQGIGKTMACSPLPTLHGHTQLSTGANNGSAQWPHGRLTLLTQQHPNFSPNDGSYRRHLSKNPKDAGHTRDVNRLLKDCPLLTKLLTSNNSSNVTFPYPKQPKTTPRSAAETSMRSNRSTTMPPVSKRYLDDDQILELIEEKLAIFRGQMKEIHLNTVPMSTCSQSAPTKLDDHISKDLVVKTASDYSKLSPELLKMKSNRAVTTKQPTGTPLSINTCHLPFFHKNMCHVELPSTKDSCLAEECTYSKDYYCPPFKSGLMDTSTINYSLSALKELIGSLDNVETPKKEIFFNNILQTYWNGDLDNVHLFTSTEYVAIMQEAAAICSKKEGEYPVVLKVPGSPATLEEFVKQNPSLIFHHTPSHQNYQSAWRNDQRIDGVKESDLHALKDIMKIVNNQPSVADCSKLSESTPTSSALEPSARETCLVAENTSDTTIPQSSDDQENEKEHLNQNSDPNTDYADKSSGTDGNVKMKHEPEGFIEQTQEKEVQTVQSKIERGLFDFKLEGLKNPEYDDLTDDEEANLRAQNSTLDMSLQKKNIDQNYLPVQPIQPLANTTPTEKVDINLSTIQSPKLSLPMQLEDITDEVSAAEGPADEGPVTGVGFIQVQTSRSPEQHLACSCPIFVETEDGFEEGLCSKCVQDISQRQEGGFEDYAGSASGHSRHENPMDPQSEDDYDWFVVPFEILDIRLEELEQEILVLDDIEDGNEENKKPSTLEQPNQPSLSCFQKLKEYDSWDSFYQSTLEKFNRKLPVVNFSADLPEPLPAPNNLPKRYAVEKATSVSATAPCAEAEDSCDTDDSSDYPLHPKRNRLTPSSLFCASDSAESEMPQLQETIRPRLTSESISSNTLFPHDKDSTNNAVNNSTVPSTVTERPSYDTSAIKETMTHHRKRKFKSRVFASDSDDDFNQDKPSKYGRNSSLVSGQASGQHSRGRAPSNLFCASGSAESEMPQPQESITLGLSSESVSSNTFLLDDEDSTNNAVINSTVTERLSSETPPNRKTMTHHKKTIVKARASDSVDDLNQDKDSKRKPGSAKKGQSSASVSCKRSSHMHQNQAVKPKSSSTASTSEHRREQRSQEKPNEASMGVVQDMPEKHQSKGNAVSEIPNGKKNANTNASQTKEQNIVRSLSQPVPNKGLSTQSEALLPVSSPFLGSSLPGTLSLNGEQYQASSLPGKYRNQPKPQKSSIVKSNQVNSYSTDKSTPAKKTLVEDWGKRYVPTPTLSKRRRSGDASARTTMTKKANGRDQEMRDHPSPRKRNNSNAAPLLKKTKSDAKAWKQCMSRQPPNDRNSENLFNGYKWRGETAKIDWERERESPELPKGLSEY